MSSSMRNFMEAYTAVHNTEAKDEFNSKKDAISEMNTSCLTDNDLREIAEQVCEKMFETVSPAEVEALVEAVISEGTVNGRESKTDRISAAFAETFKRVNSKAAKLEEFAHYRYSKRLQETWSARFNQEKRVQRTHSALVAKEFATVREGLLVMLEKKKGDPCWVGYKQVGMKKKGGKQVPNCVPEEVENVEELYKGKHGQSEKEYMDSRSDAGKQISGDSKMSGAAYSHRSFKGQGKPAKPGERQKAQGRMTPADRNELAMRKAAMKKEEFVSEKKGSKPDYLDFDGDGDKNEPMKKALKDKKKKGMKEQLEETGKFSLKEIEAILGKI
jgi:hypothetical protein